MWLQSILAPTTDAVPVAVPRSWTEELGADSSAAAAVERLVPDLLPWARAALCAATTHVRVAGDDSRTLLPKERGGDQGDGFTNLLFPLGYKGVVGRSCCLEHMWK